MKLLYLVGEPGSGKTTVSRLLFRALPSEVKTIPYVSWTEYHPSLCQIGHDREDFGGTDALSLAAQKKVIAWLEGEPYRYVYGEGDRLANGKFFAWAEEASELQVVALWNPEVATERRMRRARELDKEQNESWVTSRRTKVENIIEEYVPEELVLDAAEHPVELAKTIMRNTDVGHAIRKLRRARKSRAKS